MQLRGLSPFDHPKEELSFWKQQLDFYNARKGRVEMFQIVLRFSNNKEDNIGDTVDLNLLDRLVHLNLLLKGVYKNK